jgi:hypothetical protein
VVEVAKCLRAAVDHGAFVCKPSMIRFGLPSRMASSSAPPRTGRGCAAARPIIPDECDNRPSTR